MRFFDLHCDTATVCYPKGETLTQNHCVVSLQGAAQFFSKYGQVFSVFTPEDFQHSVAEQRALDFCAKIGEEIALSHNTILCQNRSDFDQCAKKQKNIALISLENSIPLCNNIESVQKFYDLGVRIVSLTWNSANLFAGGYLDDIGLTRQGRELLRILERFGILLDLSHLGECAAQEVLRSYNGSILATHSNCWSVCRHGRNLSDDILRELIARGSVIGLNLYAPFLSDQGAGSYDTVLRHIEHLLRLGGENSICIGTDFDGAQMQPCFDGFQAISAWYDNLAESGVGSALCDKIFYKNAFDFLNDALI